MQFKEILDREWGNIAMSLITILALVVLNNIDFLGLKVSLGENTALAVYGFGGIILYVVLLTIYEWLFVQSRVKILSAQKSYSHFMSKPFDGFSYYAVLDVVIPPKWEITDCYVTLEKDEMVHNEDRVLLDPKFSSWFADKTKPEYKLLRWKSPLANQQDCKINIGENSSREGILVGKINIASVKDRNNKITEIKNFEFCLCRAKPTEVKFNRFGLRKISLAFHWKRSGRKMITKKFNGYIYSEISGVTPKLIVRPGEYRKDKDIPKPILGKVEQVSQEPIVKEKRRISKRKKKTSPKKSS